MSIDADKVEQIRRLTQSGTMSAGRVATVVGVTRPTVLKYAARPEYFDVTASVLGWGVVFFRTVGNNRRVIVQGFHIPDTPLLKAMRIMEQQGYVVTNRAQVLADGWKKPQ